MLITTFISIEAKILIEMYLRLKHEGVLVCVQMKIDDEVDARVVITNKRVAMAFVITDYLKAFKQAKTCKW